MKRGAIAIGSSLLVTLLGGVPFAEAAVGACPELTTAEAVIACALEQHPEVIRAKAALGQAGKLESVASQIPNPELDSKGVYGTSLRDTILNFEANLGFVLELGAKRGARIQKALAERAASSAELLRAREGAYLETLSGLIRLRQLELEAAVLDRALSAFDRIQRLYRLRGKLGPEQQISLGIFQLAEGDYRVRRSTAEVEKTTIHRRLSLAVGGDLAISPALYPKPVKSWPAVAPEESAKREIKGSVMKTAQAQLQVAEAELSLAKSESWPNVKIGPSFEQQGQGPITYQTFGLNLSFPLPLFNLNGGGRAYSYQGIAKAELNLATQRSQLSVEREILIRQYRSSVEALKTLPSVAEIERKYQNVEALFQRGLVSSSIVIEAHRQIVDFTKTQNELELAALRALWKSYVLEGRIFEEKP